MKCSCNLNGAVLVSEDLLNTNEANGALLCPQRKNWAKLYSLILSLEGESVSAVGHVNLL